MNTQPRKYYEAGYEGGSSAPTPKMSVEEYWHTNKELIISNYVLSKEKFLAFASQFAASTNSDESTPTSAPIPTTQCYISVAPLSQSEVEKLAWECFIMPKNKDGELMTTPIGANPKGWSKHLTSFKKGFTHPHKPSGEWYSRADIDNAIDYGASRIEMDEGKIPYVTLDQFIASLSKENKDK